MESENVNTDTGQQETTATQTQTDGGNPAWQELYGVLPESLKPVVDPVLQKWEQGNQQKIQQYAEQQKAYEPYKDFVENNIPAESIQQALAVMQMIDQNPQEFLQQMQTFYGLQEQPNVNQQQQQPNTQQQPNNEPQGNDYSFDEQPFDLESDPRFKQIKEQQDIMANFLAMQAQQEQQAKEDAQLEADLTSLREKYGDYDEDYVLGIAMNGGELEDAVKKYKALEESIRTKPAADANLPNILTPGGGVPSENVNPADWTDQQRKAHVMNLLAQANRQG